MLHWFFTLHPWGSRRLRLGAAHWFHAWTVCDWGLWRSHLSRTKAKWWLIISWWNWLHGIFLIVRISLSSCDFLLLLLSYFTGICLSHQLHLLEHLLISRIHLKVRLKLSHSHRLSIAMCDHIIERKDQINRLLHDVLLIKPYMNPKKRVNTHQSYWDYLLTLLALLDDYLVKLPDDFQVFNDIRVLVGNEHQE